MLGSGRSIDGWRSGRTFSWPVRLLMVPVVIVITLLGLWVTAGQITSDFALSVVLSGVWFGLAGLAALLTAIHWRPLALPVLGTFVVTAGVVTAVLFSATFTDNTVDEQIAVAGGPGGNTELASGEFVGQAHEATGTAAVIEFADGNQALTFSELETDNGPDLRVYMVDGTVDDGSINGDFVDLGGLKGNVGDQQYEIPADVDPSTYSTVSIWCRAFSASFAMADLQIS